MSNAEWKVGDLVQLWHVDPDVKIAEAFRQHNGSMWYSGYVQGDNPKCKICVQFGDDAISGPGGAEDAAERFWIIPWQADTDPDDGDTTAPGTGCGQHCFAPDNMVDCDGCVSKTPEVPAVKNNDGREICVFCGAKTRKCGGARFDIDYRVCTVCRK